MTYTELDKLLEDHRHTSKNKLKLGIKRLILELIGESRRNEKLPSGDDFSYLNEAVLRERIEAL